MENEAYPITTLEEEIKIVKDISFEDLVKWLVLNIFKASVLKPEVLPVPIMLLEALFKHELPEEYWNKVKEIENVADQLYPKWQRPDKEGEEQKEKRSFFIGVEKFALLITYIKSKIPQDIIASV